MGARANIVVKNEEEQVVLYTHWDGSELPEILREALDRGRSRWDDYQYLTRIIFCQMIRGDIDGLTGYGITGQVYDNEYPIITVDVNSETVEIEGNENMSFDQYVANSPASYE